MGKVMRLAMKIFAGLIAYFVVLRLIVEGIQRMYCMLGSPLSDLETQGIHFLLLLTSSIAFATALILDRPHFYIDEDKPK
jgi:heme/copper-type cytochrome/quinol oxidase subunit 3